MKPVTNQKLTGALMALGILLVAVSVCTMVALQLSKGYAEEKAEQIVCQMQDLMPEIKSGAPDGRADTTMPMLEIDGEDFVGILEVPAYGKTLPIHSAWEKSKVAKHPCRYTGSMYDGSLVIGGSDNEGQFDFMRTITGGDVVQITDVTGLRYTYVVTDIQNMKDATTENLSVGDGDLVLFARNTYALDYTIVRCEWSGTAHR